MVIIRNGRKQEVTEGERISGIYNSEFKAMFLDTIGTSSRNRFIYFFLNVTPFEVRFDRDLCKFTQQQFVDMFVELQWFTYKTFQNYSTMYKKYIEWCCDVNEITTEQMYECFKYKKEGIPPERIINNSYYYSEKDLERRAKKLFEISGYHPSYYSWAMVAYWLSFHQLSFEDIMEIKCSDVIYDSSGFIGEIRVNRYNKSEEQGFNRGYVVKQQYQTQVLNIPYCMIKYFEYCINAKTVTTMIGEMRVPPHLYLLPTKNRDNFDYDRKATGDDFYMMKRLTKRLNDQLRYADMVATDYVDEVPQFELIYKSGLFSQVNKSLVGGEMYDKAFIKVCRTRDIINCSVKWYDEKSREPQYLREEYSIWACNCQRQYEKAQLLNLR